MHITFFSASFLTLLSWGDSGFGDELVLGACSTLLIATCAYVLGLCLGLAGALARISQSTILQLVGWLYAALFRSIPELVLILLLFYAGGDLLNSILKLLGLSPKPFNGAGAAIVVLGLVQGAYAAEILRGAILAVPKGYREAALSLGFSPIQSFRHIILPSMLPLALPGLANLWLSLTKATALVSVVGYTELTLATQQAAGFSKHYFLLYAVSLAIYLWISLMSGRLFLRLENRLRHGQAAPAMGAR